MNDPVNHPEHYTSHPSGVECIDITQHMGFCLGNAMKYIWRADLKGNALEDLEKARFYINKEIERRTYGDMPMEDEVDYGPEIQFVPCWTGPGADIEYK